MKPKEEIMATLDEMGRQNSQQDLRHRDIVELQIDIRDQLERIANMLERGVINVNRA